MLDGLIRNARVLWHAESIMADIRLKNLLARSGLLAAAGLVAIFGLGMINVAGFFWAEPQWGAARAALLVSGLDFGLALVLAFIALRAKPGRELELAQEIRQTALEGLEREAKILQQDFASLRDDLREIQRTAVGLVKHPLDSALPALIVPLASLLLKSLKKSETKPDK